MNKYLLLSFLSAASFVQFQDAFAKHTDDVFVELEEGVSPREFADSEFVAIPHEQDSYARNTPFCSRCHPHTNYVAVEDGLGHKVGGISLDPEINDFEKTQVWTAFYPWTNYHREKYDADGNLQAPWGNYLPLRFSKTDCIDCVVDIARTMGHQLQLEKGGGRVSGFALYSPEGEYVYSEGIDEKHIPEYVHVDENTNVTVEEED